MGLKHGIALTLALDALRQELARGPKGERGERGEVGERGPQGKTGPQGDRGLRGEKGERGAEGKRGERGERGPEGKKGDRGEKGDKGDKGERGSVGLSPSPDQIYAAVVTYFQNNPVKDGESFDDVEVVRRDDGITYGLRFHHTSRGWIEGGNIRVPRPFASGKPVGGGGGAAEALDGSDDATRVEVTYVSSSDNRPARVIRDAKESRYDWGTGAAGTYQYKGVAAKDSPTSAPSWTIWRTLLDNQARASVRDRLNGVAWDDRETLGWP